MMAYRDNPDATEVNQEAFIRAMKTIRPSIDKNVIKFYNDLSATMGRDISEKKKTEDLGLYQ
jgi:transitional endoplasmic reticulum ATPase